MAKKRSTGQRRRPATSFETIRHSLKPTNIEWAIRQLEVRKTPEGRFELVNSNGVPGLPRSMPGGATKGEALERARKVLREHRELLLRQQEFLRRELLKGLNFRETGNGWLLKEKDFEEFLQRIRQMRLPVYGIEAWNGDEFQATRVFEEFPAAPEDPEWYLMAFRELSRLGEGMEFFAVVDIPQSMMKRS